MWSELNIHSSRKTSVTSYAIETQWLNSRENPKSKKLFLKFNVNKVSSSFTAQKMKFFIKDFFSKCN